LFVPNENAHSKGILIHCYDNQKENAIGTKKFHQDYTLHKVDIRMTSCLLVLDMLAFCMLDLRPVHSFDLYSSMYFTRHIPYVSCIQSLMWFIQESQVFIELYAFHNDSLCSFLAFHVLIGVGHLFLFWCEFSHIFYFLGKKSPNLINITNSNFSNKEKPLLGVYICLPKFCGK